MTGAVSKRGQNTASNDGSPTAKARPVHLVWRSQCKEETSSPSLGFLRGKTMKEKESARHQETGCSVTQKSEVVNSQVSRHEKVLQATRKLGNPNKERRETSRHKEACCMLSRVSRHPPWAGFLDKFGNLQEHKIREYLECVQHYSTVDKSSVVKKF